MRLPGLLRRGGHCNRVQNIPGLPGNFTVTFTNCVRSAALFNGNTGVRLHVPGNRTLPSGVYGTPEFVQRRALGAT